MNIQIPISTKELTCGAKLERISPEESIYRNVYLILETRLGEFRYDNSYGCALWDDDFSIDVTSSGWSTEMMNKLKNNVLQNEPRIDRDFNLDIRVIQLQEDEKDSKQQFWIKLSNVIIVDTNERIQDIEYSLVFSPITIK